MSECSSTASVLAPGRPCSPQPGSAIWAHRPPTGLLAAHLNSGLRPSIAAQRPDGETQRALSRTPPKQGDQEPEDLAPCVQPGRLPRVWARAPPCGAGAGGEGSPASGSARPGRETSAALRGLLGLSCGRVQRQKGSSQAAAPKLLTAGPGGSRRPTYDFFLQVSLSSAPAVVSEPLRAFQTRLLRRDPPNPGHTPVTHAALPPRDPPPFHRHPRGCLRAPLPSSSLSAQSSLPSLAQINAKVSLQAWALSGPPLPPRRPQGYSHRGLRLCGRPPCPARARGGPQCGWVHPGTEEAPSAAPSPLS